MNEAIRLAAVWDARATWDELQEMTTVLIPVGSLEQHGPHLPLNTDALIAEALARRIAVLLEGGNYVLPALPYSSSFEHSSFSGSVSLLSRTVSSVIEDLLGATARTGAQRAVVVNAHGGNHLLRNVVQEWNATRQPRAFLVPTAAVWRRAYTEAGLRSTPSEDMHAGEAETSLLLHIAPDTVRQERLVDVDRPDRPALETLGVGAYSTTGTIGYPTHASAQKGRALLEALALGCKDCILSAD